MHSLLLQAALNIPLGHFILSLLGVIVAASGFGYALSRGRKEQMDKKLDKEVFDDYKVTTNSRLTRKVDKEVFNALFQDVESDLRAHQQASDTGFRLLKESIEANCKSQATTSELVAKLGIHIEYIRKSIDEIKPAKR